METIREWASQITESQKSNFNSSLTDELLKRMKTELSSDTPDYEGCVVALTALHHQSVAAFYERIYPQLSKNSKQSINNTLLNCAKTRLGKAAACSRISQAIRQRLRNGESAELLVPELLWYIGSVSEKILQNNLKNIWLNCGTQNCLRLFELDLTNWQVDQLKLQTFYSYLLQMLRTADGKTDWNSVFTTFLERNHLSDPGSSVQASSGLPSTTPQPAPSSDLPVEQVTPARPHPVEALSSIPAQNTAPDKILDVHKDTEDKNAEKPMAHDLPEPSTATHKESSEMPQPEPDPDNDGVKLAERLLAWARREVQGANALKSSLRSSNNDLKKLEERFSNLQSELFAAKEVCKEKIEGLWPGYKMSELPKKLLQQSELILCKTNGEAAVMSDLLFGRAAPIDHTIMQSADHKSLAPWIGMILGGCMDPIVSKDDFVSKAQAYGIKDIDTKWDALLSLDSHKRSAVLHRQEVLIRLAAMDSLPEICLNHPGSGVVVSTVHRAKGSESEHVYWLDSPLVFENQSAEEGTKADALRAAYVAVTRAKQDIRLFSMTKQYLRKISGDRWIKIWWSNKARNANKTGNAFCSGIALQPEDVDLSSCASGGNAQEVQEVISSLTPGLDVELYPSSDGTYFDILFDSYPIGRTSQTFMSALQGGFSSTNKNTNLPHNIDSAYISSLVTVIQLGGTTGENAYHASGCWLGYELSGFAHINYT